MKRIACGLAVLTLSMLALSRSVLAQNPTPAQEYFLARMDPPYILPEGVRVEADIVFASPDGRDLHLDLFAPGPGTGPLPAILFIQGSGYNGNNKASFWREAAYFATRGFIGASIEASVPTVRRGRRFWPTAEPGSSGCGAAARVTESIRSGSPSSGNHQVVTSQPC